jgi:hypothetical protein
MAPFAPADVSWDATTTNDAGDEVLLTPRLSRRAIVARLDEVGGVAGWSLILAPTEGGIVATLRVDDVTKSAAADHLAVVAPSAEETADRALARAAEAFGLRPAETGPRWAPFDPDARVVLDDAPAPAPAAADLAEESAVPDVMRSSAAARGLTPEALQMIDRLVERLKEEGQGLAAARLLVKHGGYGNDPAAARELYAQLRALLLRAGEPRA